MNAITSSKEDLRKELTENVSARMDKMQNEVKAIRIRQKHNRIADRSDWGVVTEYLADELADNPKDEKRLYKAKKERYIKKKRMAAENTTKKCRRTEVVSKAVAPVEDQAGPMTPKMRLLGHAVSVAIWQGLATSRRLNDRIL